MFLKCFIVRFSKPPQMLIILKDSNPGSLLEANYNNLFY